MFLLQKGLLHKSQTKLITLGPNWLLLWGPLKAGKPNTSVLVTIISLAQVSDLIEKFLNAQKIPCIIPLVLRRWQQKKNQRTTLQSPVVGVEFHQVK